MRLLVLLSLSLIVIGCSSGPAYKDIDPDEVRRSGESGAAIQPPAQAPQETTDPQTGQTRRESMAAAVPSFVRNRDIEDLPRYPRSQVENMTMGPQEGYETAMITMASPDGTKEIIEFYEREIKRNGWQVRDRIGDTESARWELFKGERDEAIVQVQFNEQRQASGVMLYRIRKAEESAKQ